MQYRQTIYRSLTGEVKTIKLIDFVYGEWIVYDGDEPRYHINVFDITHNSNSIIKKIIGSGKQIEQILSDINIRHNTGLKLKDRPLISIEKETNLVELNLTPLPEHLLININ